MSVEMITQNDDPRVVYRGPCSPAPYFLLTGVHRVLPPLRLNPAGQLAEVGLLKLALQRSEPGRPDGGAQHG